MELVKFAKLMELGIVAITVWFVVFQIVVPLILGTPFFPILRTRPKKALEKLAEATEESEIDAVKKSTAALRASTKSTE